MMSQGFQKSSKWRTNSSTYWFFVTIPSNSEMHQPIHDKHIPCMAWNGRFVEIQSNLRWKKTSNQGSSFLGGSFSNRDYVAAPVQFRKESQSQHLKKWFFLKTRPIQTHQQYRVIRLIKRNQFSFSSIEISKSCPPPLHSVS